ncbi:hypothetical protein [Mycolicibacterium mageritense]|uniref:hypothetical protein n=1 Tax=Mycolicibacterium mageritense TaxID=53462 RepID=UPI00257222DB|nr:hypothetical protein [Mycolicibacterium mageritense]
MRVDHQRAAQAHWSACIAGMAADCGKTRRTTRIDRDPDAGPYARSVDERRPRRWLPQDAMPWVRITLAPNPKGLDFISRPWFAAVQLLCATTDLKGSECIAKNQATPVIRTSRPRNGAQPARESVPASTVNGTARRERCSTPTTAWVMLPDQPTKRECRIIRDEHGHNNIDAVLEVDRADDHDDLLTLDDGSDWGPTCTDERCTMWRLQHRYPCEI